jgi:hypothetical protein
MSITAVIFGYVAILVNSVYLVCLGWFARNPHDDFLGGFIGLPALFCWLLSIPSALVALILSVVALLKRRSLAHSIHALAVSLVACALAALARFQAG